MSALARYFMREEHDVAGYDLTRSRLTLELEGEGIPIHYDDKPSAIPEEFRSPGNVTVIYTPAVPADHTELRWFRYKGFQIYKRSEVLGSLTDRESSIAVAGSHGKTTICSMIAHLMEQSGTSCLAFLGGIAKNFGSNLVYHKDPSWVLCEADEFDRSFLKLSPSVAVVTAMDPDHLDIYSGHRELREAFNQFIRCIKPGGLLIYKKGLTLDIPDNLTGYTYSIKGHADFNISRISAGEGSYVVNMRFPGDLVQQVKLAYPGRMNAENALAAAAVCWVQGIGTDDIALGLESFTGVQRRFDKQVEKEGFVYIDDYAHHPEEIRALLASVKELYPKWLLTGVFQPHLYSRTGDFTEDFAKSLEAMDEVILMDIYPAREEAIPGISSENILKRIKPGKARLMSRQEILEYAQKGRFDLFMTLGAGDIDRLVDPLKEIFENRYS